MNLIMLAHAVVEEGEKEKKKYTYARAHTRSSKTSFSRHTRRLIAVTLVSYVSRSVIRAPALVVREYFRAIDAKYFTLSRKGISLGNIP